MVAAVVACAPILARAQSPAFFPLHTIWTVSLSDRPGAAPLFIASVGYVPIAGKRLAAYDLVDGRQAWLVEADARAQPAASDELLFVAEEGALSALRTADGSRVWRVPLDHELATPLVLRDEWLIAADQTTVLSFHAADGRLAWRRDLGSRAHAAPALAADAVYVPIADGRVVALRRETGATIWEKKLGGPANDLLALEDRLYVGSHDNFFYALDPKDGTVLWRWRTGGDVIGLPVADERRVYFVSLDNTLYALNRRSGGLEWRRPLPLRPSSGPIRAGNTLVVSGSDATLYGFQIANGQPAGSVPVGALTAPPFVSSGPPPAPLLITVTDDLGKGASITARGPETEVKAAPAANSSDRFE